MTAPTRIHYAGSVHWTNAKGEKTNILMGWATCCTGDRAQRILDRRQQTYEEQHVTCLACLRVLRLARDSKLIEDTLSNASAAGISDAVCADVRRNIGPK